MYFTTTPASLTQRNGQVPRLGNPTRHPMVWCRVSEAISTATMVTRELASALPRNKRSRKIRAVPNAASSSQRDLDHDREPTATRIPR